MFCANIYINSNNKTAEYKSMKYDPIYIATEQDVINNMEYIICDLIFRFGIYIFKVFLNW
jgi:hypothetical protein